MSPRPDVSTERTNQIIAAAKTVFARLGFKKARMEDIARETGVSKGTLYLYFKSKDDIITSILDDMFERQLTRAIDSLEADLSAEEKLSSFTDIVVDDLKSMKPLLPILFEFLSLVMRKKVVKDRIRNYYQNYIDAITPLIQQGIEAGEFRPLGAEEIAIAAGAIFEGTIVMWAYAPDVVDIEKHIQSSMQMLIEGLKTNT